MVHFIHRIFRLNGLVSRFFFWIIMIVFITSFAYLITYSAVDKKNRLEEVKTDLQYELLNQKATLENWSADREEEVHLLASFPVAKESNYDIMAARFSYYHQYYHQLHSIVFIDKEGQVIIDTALEDAILQNIEANVSDREYFQAAKEGEKLIYYVLEKRSTGDETVIFSSPVESNDNEFNGVILTAVHLENVNQLLSEMIKGNTGKITFANVNGEIISELTKESSDLFVSEKEEKYLSDELMQLLQQTNSNFAQMKNEQGEKVFVSFTSLLNDQFYLINEITEQEVLQPHNRMVMMMFTITLTIILITFALFFPVSRMLLQPFSHLLEGINQMREGAYNVQLDPDKFRKSPRELRQMMIVFNQMSTSIQKNKNLLKELSNTDGLTGVANRRLFEERLSEYWHIYQKKQQPVSLLFIDVDYFKNYNDSFGHLKGDACLVKIAQAINDLPERDKLVARYGGEEFVIILPEKTDDQAYEVAKEVQETVKQLRINRSRQNDEQFVTVSIGVATMIPTDGDGKEALIQLADQAVYEAKSEGRNRIIRKMK